MDQKKDNTKNKDRDVMTTRTQVVLHQQQERIARALNDVFLHLQKSIHNEGYYYPLHHHQTTPPIQNEGDYYYPLHYHQPTQTNNITSPNPLPTTNSPTTATAQDNEGTPPLVQHLSLSSRLPSSSSPRTAPPTTFLSSPSLPSSAGGGLRRSISRYFLQSSEPLSFDSCSKLINQHFLYSTQSNKNGITDHVQPTGGGNAATATACSECSSYSSSCTSTFSCQKNTSKIQYPPSFRTITTTTLKMWCLRRALEILQGIPFLFSCTSCYPSTAAVSPILTSPCLANSFLPIPPTCTWLTFCPGCRGVVRSPPFYAVFDKSSWGLDVTHIQLLRHLIVLDPSSQVRAAAIDVCTASLLSFPLLNICVELSLPEFAVAALESLPEALTPVLGDVGEIASYKDQHTTLEAERFAALSLVRRWNLISTTVHPIEIGLPYCFIASLVALCDLQSPAAGTVPPYLPRIASSALVEGTLLSPLPPGVDRWPIGCSDQLTWAVDGPPDGASSAAAPLPAPVSLSGRTAEIACGFRLMCISALLDVAVGHTPLVYSAGGVSVVTDLIRDETLLQGKGTQATDYHLTDSLGLLLAHLVCSTSTSTDLLRLKNAITTDRFAEAKFPTTSPEEIDGVRQNPKSKIRSEESNSDSVAALTSYQIIQSEISRLCGFLTLPILSSSFTPFHVSNIGERFWDPLGAPARTPFPPHSTLEPPQPTAASTQPPRRSGTHRHHRHHHHFALPRAPQPRETAKGRGMGAVESQDNAHCRVKWVLACRGLLLICSTLTGLLTLASNPSGLPALIQFLFAHPKLANPQGGCLCPVMTFFAALLQFGMGGSDRTYCRLLVRILAEGGLLKALTFLCCPSTQGRLSSGTTSTSPLLTPSGVGPPSSSLHTPQVYSAHELSLPPLSNLHQEEEEVRDSSEWSRSDDDFVSLSLSLLAGLAPMRRAATMPTAPMWAVEEDQRPSNSKKKDDEKGCNFSGCFNEVGLGLLGALLEIASNVLPQNIVVDLVYQTVPLNTNCRVASLLNTLAVGSSRSTFGRASSLTTCVPIGLGSCLAIAGQPTAAQRQATELQNTLQLLLFRSLGCPETLLEQSGVFSRQPLHWNWMLLDRHLSTGPDCERLTAVLLRTFTPLEASWRDVLRCLSCPKTEELVHRVAVSTVDGMLRRANPASSEIVEAWVKGVCKLFQTDSNRISNLLSGRKVDKTEQVEEFNMAPLISWALVGTILGRLRTASIEHVLVDLYMSMKQWASHLLEVEKRLLSPRVAMGMTLSDGIPNEGATNILLGSSVIDAPSDAIIKRVELTSSGLRDVIELLLDKGSYNTKLMCLRLLRDAAAPFDNGDTSSGISASCRENWEWLLDVSLEAVTRVFVERPGGYATSCRMKRRRASFRLFEEGAVDEVFAQLLLHIHHLSLPYPSRVQAKLLSLWDRRPDASCWPPSFRTLLMRFEEGVERLSGPPLPAKSPLNVPPGVAAGGYAETLITAMLGRRFCPSSVDFTASPLDSISCGQTDLCTTFQSLTDAVQLQRFAFLSLPIVRVKGGPTNATSPPHPLESLPMSLSSCCSCPFCQHTAWEVPVGARLPDLGGEGASLSGVVQVVVDRPLAKSEKSMEVKEEDGREAYDIFCNAVPIRYETFSVGVKSNPSVSINSYYNCCTFLNDVCASSSSSTLPPVAPSLADCLDLLQPRHSMCLLSKVTNVISNGRVGPLLVPLVKGARLRAIGRGALLGSLDVDILMQRILGSSLLRSCQSTEARTFVMVSGGARWWICVHRLPPDTLDTGALSPGNSLSDSSVFPRFSASSPVFISTITLGGFRVAAHVSELQLRIANGPPDRIPRTVLSTLTATDRGCALLESVGFVPLFQSLLQEEHTHTVNDLRSLLYYVGDIASTTNGAKLLTMHGVLQEVVTLALSVDTRAAVRAACWGALANLTPGVAEVDEPLVERGWSTELGGPIHALPPLNPRRTANELEHGVERWMSDGESGATFTASSLAEGRAGWDATPGPKEAKEKAVVTTERERCPTRDTPPSRRSQQPTRRKRKGRKDDRTDGKRFGAKHEEAYQLIGSLPNTVAVKSRCLVTKLRNLRECKGYVFYSVDLWLKVQQLLNMYRYPLAQRRLISELFEDTFRSTDTLAYLDQLRRLLSSSPCGGPSSACGGLSSPCRGPSSPCGGPPSPCGGPPSPCGSPPSPCGSPPSSCEAPSS